MIHFNHEDSEMIIGVPREIKIEEFRVRVTPVVARELVRGNHKVLVETDAGAGSGVLNDDRKAGAEIEKRQTILGRAELIVKVKEPVTSEYPLLRSSLFHSLLNLLLIESGYIYSFDIDKGYASVPAFFHFFTILITIFFNVIFYQIYTK